MLSPFAEAIASRREIACSAVSDFAQKIQSGVVCAAWGSSPKAYSLQAKDILWSLCPNAPEELLAVD